MSTYSQLELGPYGHLMNESDFTSAYSNTIQNHETIYYGTPATPATPATPSTPSTPYTPTSHNRKRPANHIPRPPNAFLLYRSDFLKGGKIPQEEETRQQNLSRIVGECWKRLNPKEREHWHALAKQAEEEHAQRYPNYVYKPVRRESVLRRRQKKSKEEEQQRCEELRKTYIPETVDQPPVKIDPPARKRKSRAKKKPEPVVTSTDSLHSDAQLSADVFSGNAFMEPLIAPPNLSEQSLEAFHENTVPESSPPEVNFSNLGHYDPYPVYSDEYYNTLGVDQVAPPPSQIPQPSSAPTTFANELHERFQRDKAAGAATTTAMFNAQYVDPSFFNSQPQFFSSFLQTAQSPFFPSSSQSGSSASFNCTSEPVFQDLLLPPAMVPSFMYSQQPQVNGNFGGFSEANPPMSFPLTVQSNNQLCDFNLIEPAFNVPTNSSEITINLDGFDISLDDLNLTTLCGNFAPEIPTPLFGGEIPTLAYDWNDLDKSIDPINNN
ncbi:hypothetical protein Clacol_001260 [Clathrus columnatus]|uniref:HMG box domain-containing protein n=1 Tax=Clathrus columnatus TaxID=1419009 RepID=A0AAV5A224_9AGAM|nr:hypothetical protein Clacol_001260 [Clathrus columnatus]